ncbi:hypothetical protein PsorP6_018892 [Peronosclerospora sorghi]|nr:hypothetical protein PsorP6_018892 [Peronosclerospora sorghi]
MLPRVLVWLSLLSANVLASYGPRDSVVILTDKNFERKCCKVLTIGLSSFTRLGNFLACDCITFKRLRTMMLDLATGARVQGSGQEVKKTCPLLWHSFPCKTKSSNFLYDVGAFGCRGCHGGAATGAQDYRGGRTSKDIVQYVKNLAEAKKLGVSSANVVALEYDKVHTGKKMKHSAMSGTKDESAISEFLDKLIDGSSSFSVTSKDPETLAAAVAGLSAKHEEL